MRTGTMAIAAGLAIYAAFLALTHGAWAATLRTGADPATAKLITFLVTAVVQVGSMAYLWASPLAIAAIVLVGIGIMQRMGDRRPFPGAAPQFK